ncbi:hypothetical protein J3A83DRAFT_4099471 [Scleroderma citrinum]
MSTQTQQTAPLTRSSSFFGAIKNIVTAPLQWLSGTDDFEDTKGKRRRLPVLSEQSRVEEDSLHGKTKRMRVASPGRDTHPYLDPPMTVFKQSRRTSEQVIQSQQGRISVSPRKTLHVPTDLSARGRSTRNRRTHSPLPSRSHPVPESITRTMSLDPPSNSSFSFRTQSVASMQDVEEYGAAENSMSISRDSSMSPGRQLRVRSSLTPQPSGPNFGPVVPPRRERDPNQPPPLAALRSNPTFVKPPPGLQKLDATESAKQLTLGSLVESQRSSRSPVRQSSLLFGTGSTMDVSARNLWPANAAEKALHELEVYKTPLLPTRLKASGTIPDMFLPKKSHQITLMNDDRDNKPRLGMKGKGKDKGKKKEKEKEAPKGSKPYAGEGGMKKWLARRRMEEEQAKEREKANAMEDDDGEEVHKESLEEENRIRINQLVVHPPSTDTVFQPGLIRDSHETSSLRVGRTKITRNHDRPISRRMKKFSAAYEDEDDEMDDSRAAEQKILEEAAKKAPAFEISAGFTFAKETSITHDVANAKEPPIGSLPFSLMKPVTTSSTLPSVEPASKPVLPAERSDPITTPAVTLAPPPIILSPPSDKVDTVPSTSASVSPPTTLAPPVTAPSGIPNFFATSSLISKPPATVAPPPPSFSAALSQPTPVSKPLTDGKEQRAEPEALKVAESAAPMPSAPQLPVAALPTLGTTVPSGTSLFGAPSTSTGAPAISLFSAPVATTGMATSLFGPSGATATSKESEVALASPLSSLAPSPFSFGVTKPAESSPPVLAEPTKPEQKETEAPTTKPAAPFSFGFTTPATSAPTTEAPKPSFSFGQPTASSAPAQPEAAKPLFGGTSTSSFSFGVAPAQPTGETKPTSTFSFGATTTASAAQPSGETKPASTFSFGTTTTTTTTSAPAFTFGPPSSGSNAADVSAKPFSFAPSTSARPATPPKVEQEVNMDESPTREMNINGNGKASERPTLSFPFTTPTTSGSALFAQSPVTSAPVFSFGSPTVNPFAKDTKAAEEKPKASFGFGQQPSTGFSFGQKPPESPAVASPAPFSFGQPSPSVAPQSPFTFGTASSNPFGQASTAGASAPSSPSTFNRPASTPAFGFGSSATTQPSSTPFAFGTSSQPASPANSNITLPPSSSAPAFTFGAPSGTTAPANPFGTPAGSSPAAAGAGTLFTIGSAPPPQEGGRQIKKLPRRGGARR